MAEQEQGIEAQYRAQMNQLAHFLGDELRPSGFALFVFDMNAPGRMNYISNASRPHMLEAMREFIARNNSTYVAPNNVFQVLDKIDEIADTALTKPDDSGHARAALHDIRAAIKRAREFHQ
jgi:hypothetical protein